MTPLHRDSTTNEHHPRPSQQQKQQQQHQNHHHHHRQEILLLSSITYEILARSTLPTKISKSKVITAEAMDQTPRGTYTVAATAAKGGIRLFRTETLQHLSTFGEGVALHGHTISWQQCLFIPWYYSSAWQQPTKEMRGDDDYDGGGDGGKVELNPSSSSSSSQRGRFIEREDELRYRCQMNKTIETTKTKEKSDDDDDDNDDDEANNTSTATSLEEDSLEGMLLAAVPNAFREPRELNETIHFWDCCCCQTSSTSSQSYSGAKLPTFTMVAPAKSGGIIAFLCDESPPPVRSGVRFVLSTRCGECFTMMPKLRSDWAGRMYPPGYQLIDNNLIYIEDEDELDEVVDDDLNGAEQVYYSYRGMKNHARYGTAVVNSRRGGYLMAQNGTGDDLAMALKLSAEDIDPENVHVNVVTDYDEASESTDFLSSPCSISEKNSLVPCHPEPHIQEELKKRDNSSSTTSRSPTATMASLLAMLPQHEEVQQILEDRKEEEEGEKCRADAREGLDSVKTETKNIAPIKTPYRGKRAKIRTQEALLNSSINPVLRRKMLEREKWADGTGSSLRWSPPELPNNNDSNETDITDQNTKKKNPACEACLGRMVYHRCGLRIIPDDQDAIFRAAKEREAREEEEKKEQRRAKRRLLDAKRREAKRKERREEKERELAERKAREEQEEEQQQQEKVEQQQQQQEEEEEQQLFVLTANDHEQEVLQPDPPPILNCIPYPIQDQGEDRAIQQQHEQKEITIDTGSSDLQYWSENHHHGRTRDDEPPSRIDDFWQQYDTTTTTTTTTQMEQQQQQHTQYETITQMEQEQEENAEIRRYREEERQIAMELAGMRVAGTNVSMSSMMMQPTTNLEHPETSASATDAYATTAATTTFHSNGMDMHEQEEELSMMNSGQGRRRIWNFQNTYSFFPDGGSPTLQRPPTHPHEN